jgi:hypothetical protein
MPGFKGYNFTHIMKGASEGMEELVKLLTKSKNGFK